MLSSDSGLTGEVGLRFTTAVWLVFGFHDVLYVCVNVFFI